MILINHKTGNHQLIAKYFEELAFHPLFQIVALINQAIISNRFQESKKPTTISIFSYVYHFLWTSLLCKVEFTLLQSIFSRQIFLLYFGKGKFGGKKFTLQKSEFYFAKEFFPFFMLKLNALLDKTTIIMMK
jgi:hypothetical protein